MSEYFCHAVHGDDCAALMQASRIASSRTKRVLRESGALMRMGSVLRAGATLVTPALTAIRDGDRSANERASDRRLAVALSQLSHRATDGLFKPLYRELAPEYYDSDYSMSPSDIRIMQDIALYHSRRGMRLADGDPKYDPMMFRHLVPLADSVEPANARFVETMFAARVLQELLDLHQLAREEASTIEHLHAYMMALDPIYIDTARYADMAAQPYHNLVQRYIVEPNFYDPEDPWVSLAVDIQNGEPADPDRLEAARNTPESELSQWGVSLSMGVRYYEAAQRYMDREITESEFRQEALT